MSNRIITSRFYIIVLMAIALCTSSITYAQNTQLIYVPSITNPDPITQISSENGGAIRVTETSKEKVINITRKPTGPSAWGLFRMSAREFSTAPENASIQQSTLRFLCAHVGANRAIVLNVQVYVIPIGFQSSNTQAHSYMRNNTGWETSISGCSYALNNDGQPGHASIDLTPLASQIYTSVRNNGGSGEIVLGVKIAQNNNHNLNWDSYYLSIADERAHSTPIVINTYLGQGVLNVNGQVVIEDEDNGRMIPYANSSIRLVCFNTISNQDQVVGIGQTDSQGNFSIPSLRFVRDSACEVTSSPIPPASLQRTVSTVTGGDPLSPLETASTEVTILAGSESAQVIIQILSNDISYPFALAFIRAQKIRSRYISLYDALDYGDAPGIILSDRGVFYNPRLNTIDLLLTYSYDELGHEYGHYIAQHIYNYGNIINRGFNACLANNMTDNSWSLNGSSMNCPCVATQGCRGGGPATRSEIYARNLVFEEALASVIGYNLTGRGDNIVRYPSLTNRLVNLETGEGFSGLPSINGSTWYSANLLTLFDWQDNSNWSGDNDDQANFSLVRNSPLFRSIVDNTIDRNILSVYSGLSTNALSGSNEPSAQSISRVMFPYFTNTVVGNGGQFIVPAQGETDVNPSIDKIVYNSPVNTVSVRGAFGAENLAPGSLTAFRINNALLPNTSYRARLVFSDIHGGSYPQRLEFTTGKRRLEGTYEQGLNFAPGEVYSVVGNVLFTGNYDIVIPGPVTFLMEEGSSVKFANRSVNITGYRDPLAPDNITGQVSFVSGGRPWSGIELSTQSSVFDGVYISDASNGINILSEGGNHNIRHSTIENSANAGVLVSYNNLDYNSSINLYRVLVDRSGSYGVEATNAVVRIDRSVVQNSRYDGVRATGSDIQMNNTSVQANSRNYCFSQIRLDNSQLHGGYRRGENIIIHSTNNALSCIRNLITLVGNSSIYLGGDTGYGGSIGGYNILEKNSRWNYASYIGSNPNGRYNMSYNHYINGGQIDHNPFLSSIFVSPIQHARPVFSYATGNTQGNPIVGNVHPRSNAIEIENGEIIYDLVASKTDSNNAEISSVYPNPASRSASIRITLGTPADVSVRVYDVTGRQVAVAAEGFRAAGTSAVEVDTRALAAGLYVVRVEANGAVVSRRLTVAR